MRLPAIAFEALEQPIKAFDESCDPRQKETACFIFIFSMKA